MLPICIHYVWIIGDEAEKNGIGSESLDYTPLFYPLCLILCGCSVSPRRNDVDVPVAPSFEFALQLPPPGYVHIGESIALHEGVPDYQDVLACFRQALGRLKERRSPNNIGVVLEDSVGREASNR